MALNRVDLGIQYFPQFAADRAIANAQIYIGLPNLDPAVLANQIQAYVVQENGTQVAVPQPIRTSAGGVPTYNGSPVEIVISEVEYSLKILSSTGSQIYYKSIVTGSISPSNVTLHLENYTDLRAYVGNASTIYLTGDLTSAQPQGVAGTFQYDETDVTSADNGFNIIVASNGKRWKRVSDNKSSNIQWGQVFGDNTTVNTTNINDVVQDQSNLGGGVVEIPRGTYLAQEADITFNNVQTVSWDGDKRGSTLRSPTASTFAAKAKFVSGIIRRTVQDISNIRFDGASKTTCGLSITKRQSVMMNHLEFSENVLGLFSAGNFYYGINNPYLSENDVGLMFGMYDIGSPITGLLNGSGGSVSVSVPDPTAISGHSGNKYIRDGQARVNRIGLAFMGGNNPDIVIEKMTIEANNIGALCTGGQYTFRHCWFEANADTPGSTTLQGRTYEYAGIFAKGEGGVTPTAQVRMDGGRIEKAIIDVDAALELDDVLVVNSVTTQNGGTAVANRVTGIGRAFNFLAYRPVPYTKELARFVTSLTPPKVSRIYQMQPINGNVRCADDCTAAAFQSTTLSGVNIAQTFSNIGGVFSNQTYIRTTYQADTTAPRSRLRITLDPADITVGSGAVVLYLMVRVSDPLFRFRMIGAQSGQMFSVADPSVSFTNRANQWTPVVMVCTPNASTIDLGAEGLLAPATVDFSGIQVVSFANKTDAGEYCAQNLFYMTEAP